MCGRYTLASDIDEFLAHYGIDVPQELAHPRTYNVAPSQPVLGVVADPGVRVELFEWGFVPTWARPETKPKPVINARVESIIEAKPYFRGAFRSARCAILADGFYEWKKEEDGKHPFLIGLKEGGPFAMAGLWAHTKQMDGAEQLTCAIITVPPNELMESIHNRMPAILRPDDFEVWIDPKSSDRHLFQALEPYPADRLKAVEVSRLVNSPANNTPDCIRPIDD